MTERMDLTVDAGEVGERIDVVVSRRSDESRAFVADLIRTGNIHLNGRPAKPSARVAPGDHISGSYVRRPSLSAQPEDLPLSVVYQDADLAIIDKPAGMVVHPAAGHTSGTLTNALMAHFPSIGDVGEELRPGIVHRLDKDTSGLMVVALTAPALRDLQNQIRDRSARRVYLALASGGVLPPEGTIEVPIGRDPTDRKRMAAYGLAARSAITHYTVLHNLDGFTYLRVSLQTGRTHQIRVHFAAGHHPIAGDRTYGGASLPGLHRQFLHAAELHVRSPSTGVLLTFHSQLPPDLHEVLATLIRKS